VLCCEVVRHQEREQSKLTSTAERDARKRVIAFVLKSQGLVSPLLLYGYVSSSLSVLVVVHQFSPSFTLCVALVLARSAIDCRLLCCVVPVSLSVTNRIVALVSGGWTNVEESNNRSDPRDQAGQELDCQGSWWYVDQCCLLVGDGWQCQSSPLPVLMLAMSWWQS
jgi:hypothetical protein